MIALHQLYIQLKHRAQLDPLARVKDFKIMYSESSAGKIVLRLKYTRGMGKAVDLAATVLAWYSDSYNETGPSSNKYHWFPDFKKPVQRVYGTQLISLEYAP